MKVKVGDKMLKIAEIIKESKREERKGERQNERAKQRSDSEVVLLARY